MLLRSGSLPSTPWPSEREEREMERRNIAGEAGPGSLQAIKSVTISSLSVLCPRRPGTGQGQVRNDVARAKTRQQHCGWKLLHSVGGGQAMTREGRR